MADLLTLWSFQILDELGVTASHDIFMKVPDSTTLANLAGLNVAYQLLLDPLTAGQITKSEVRVVVPIDSGVTPTPQAGSEVERTGLMNFSQTGNSYKAGIDIPALNENLIVNGKIDLTNADLSAWIAWMTAAHSGSVAVTKFLITLIGLVDALISFRKHRKAEARRSLSIP